MTKFYNASLSSSWLGGKSNDLATLPKGLHTLDGVEFDVRGIIQLGSKSPSSTNYPAQVKGIPVHQPCRQLHFLHAAAFGSPAEEGTQIGTYVVNFATNQTRLQIPIRYGSEVRDWHVLPGELPAPEDLTVVWRGANALSKSEDRSIRLFLTTWTNTAPEVPIQTIDYVSSIATAAPFLIAITAE